MSRHSYITSFFPFGLYSTLDVLQEGRMCHGIKDMLLVANPMVFPVRPIKALEAYHLLVAVLTDPCHPAYIYER